jgi:hypothetical protein
MSKLTARTAVARRWLWDVNFEGATTGVQERNDAVLLFFVMQRGCAR